LPQKSRYLRSADCIPQLVQNKSRIMLSTRTKRSATSMLLPRLFISATKARLNSAVSTVGCLISLPYVTYQRYANRLQSTDCVEPTLRYIPYLLSWQQLRPYTGEEFYCKKCKSISAITGQSCLSVWHAYIRRAKPTN